MPPVRLYPIGTGYAGTRDTLAFMRALARRESQHPLVQSAAAQIVEGAADAESKAGLIREWVDQHSAFQRDPIGLEWVIAPTEQLTRIGTDGSTSGDCDDVAVLTAALGLAAGLRAKFIVLGRTHFEHVFTVLGDGRHWWELDTTRPFQDVPADLQRNIFTAEV